MSTIPKKAGFWVRFISRVFDSVLIFSTIIAIAFIGLDKNPKIHFESVWFFYVWIFSSIILIFLYFILLPAYMNRTLFMFVFRVKIEFDSKNKFSSMVKRELFFSVVWIISLSLCAMVINHTLINKFALSDQSKIKYTSWETFRISIFTTITSVFVVGQFISSISIIVRKPNGALHDTFSNTKTIWVNKVVEVKEVRKENVVGFKPKKVNQEEIIWI